MCLLPCCSLLVPLHESPLIGLFEDVRGQTK